ncbi:50S ribosomal protein L10 [Candidatus Bathyarchaeota archaeon]|nr:50S ribosomal protein L10 [Candidatus Bathyarchaeota archaeon]MBS7630069.1 50S ribosomal protein L10 [Candidatus Bathyarchaeota archaeon]
MTKSIEKQTTVDAAIKLLNEYDVVFAADLFKMESVMLQGLRKQLRGKITIKCIKNTLIKIAMEKVGFENADQFLSQIKGSTIFIFSNGNPFKIASELNRNKVKVFAKPGDLALNDLIIPAGNTGLSPGPIIGKFGALGIKTRIEGGNIWVNQDAKVASAGEKISEDLADILTRLGIKASEMGLSIKAAYDRGRVIMKDELIYSLDTYKGELKKAIFEAYNVAISSSYLTRETSPILVKLANENARKISILSEYITPQNVTDFISITATQAKTLERLVAQKQK